jgi:protein O-mannosyl-transferase
LLTEPGVILHYLRLSMWPYPLCLDYGWPMARTWMSILPSALVMATLLGATAWACKTNSTWGFLSVWLFLILAPTSSLFPLDSPRYEHRMYLSLAAVVALVVLGLYSLAGRRSLAVFVLVAIGFGFLTTRRNEDYRSEIAFWEDTVAKRPENYGAHNNLGIGLGRSGKLEEAMVHFEQALRLKPDYAEAHCNLGAALRQAGRVTEAIEQLEQALRLKPDYAAAHHELGLALEQAGRVPEAMDHYEHALRIKPDYAEAHNNLGVALARSGKLEEAIRHLEEALRIDPDYAKAHKNLGIALEQTGNVREAIRHYEQALRVKPDYAEARDALARLQARQ